MNEDFQRDLRRIRRRIRLLLVEKHALTVGAAAAGAAAVLVLLSKWFDALAEPLLLFMVVAAGLVAGAAWGMLRRLTPFATARAAEKRLDLKERLSSAVSISERSAKPVIRSAQSEMEEAVVEDAARHAQAIRPSDVFAHRFGREMAVFGVMLAVLLGLYYIPQIPAVQSPTRRAEVRVMKREGARLRELAKEAIKRVSPENRQIVRRVALNMERLGKRLESGRMTRKQAMLSLAKLSKDIKDTQDRLAAKAAGQKPMSQAVKDMRDASAKLARKMLEQIEKQRRKNGKIDPKMEELSKRLKDLQASSGKMSDEEVRRAEKELSRFLQGEKGVPVPPELARMFAELLKNEDYRKAMELMNELAKKLGRGQMSEADMKNLAEQLKALAEALKGTDLNELARRLRLTAEMLSELDAKDAAKILAQMKKLPLPMPADLAMLGKMGGG